MVKKILHIVLKKYKQVTITIEMLKDLDVMTIKELISQLLVVEDANTCEEKEVADSMGRLLLTQEQWEARC